MGSGVSVDAILAALKHNGKPFSYTVVDNWAEFPGGRMPLVVAEKYGRYRAFCVRIACSCSYES